MKLLLICYGGLTEDRRAMYREYAKKGINLTVVVPSFIPVDKTYSLSGNLTYGKEYEEKGYTFIPVNIIKPGLIDSFNIFGLYKAIRKANPDIIEVFNEYTSLHLTQTIFCRNMLYKNKRKVPVLAYTFENIPFNATAFAFNFSLSSLKNTVRKITRPFILRYHKKNVQGVVSCNQEGIDNLKKMGLRFPMVKIFRSVEVENFYKKEKIDCRKKIGVEAMVKLIGCFCRLIKEKGLTDLATALALLKDYHLMIVGNGNYEQSLKKKIKELGVENRAHFYHSVPSKELVDYYNCLDIFVLPSKTTGAWKEQYGMVLIEAMACQIPVVGSSSGAIPEVLEGYPKGLIFKEGQADDLAEKIKKATSLKFPETFDAHSFIYKFGVENFVLEHIKFYKKLLP